MNPAHLTKARQQQIQKSLELVEQSFSKGNITRATYVQRKDDLLRLLNQSRTLNQSELSKNPGGFFSRNVVNLSPAPVGFLEAMGLKKPTTRSQTYVETGNQFWQPGDFLNDVGLRQGQKALNQNVAPAPALNQGMENQLVNQGYNRASNTEIRKALLEASNRETWNEMDIQSVLNNQETSYQTSVEVASGNNGLGLNVTNLPSYDRFSKNAIGTYQAESVVHSFIQRLAALDFSKSNIFELIEGEARSTAISLYYAQIPPEDIQTILVNAITGTSSELLNSFEAIEAVNNGADIMNQAKTGPESTLFNSFYNTFGPNQMVMNPSMSDPLNAIDLPTLYAMAEEATGNEANLIQAEIITRQDAMAQIRKSSKTSRMKQNATGRGYNTSQAIKNRIATNKAFETSVKAIEAQKADFLNVIDDILRIDGKLILDITTGQFNAFVTVDEINNAIRGINYALAAEYWTDVERNAFNDVYTLLKDQLEAMSSGGPMPAMGPSAASMSVQSPSGNYAQSQQSASQQSASQQSASQQNNNLVQQNLNQSNSGYSLNYDWYLSHIQSGAMPQPPNWSPASNQEIFARYGEVTGEVDNGLDNDPYVMVDYWSLHEQMVNRGLFNQGIQGAPRTLGILSGLHGATTSTSSSSAHGPMRMHVARMNKDPREGMYEY